MTAPFSRRLVIKTLGDMFESDASTNRVAEILAAYLVQNRKVRESELFIRDLRRELEKRFGLASVEVKSAHKLTEDVSRAIEEFVKKQTNADEVEIMSSADESLIAGVVISTTDSELDGSLKSKIRKLKMV